MKRSKKKERAVSFILLAAFFVFSVNMFDKVHVYGNSMAPSLYDGDYVLTERFSYLFGKPKRFDVVVFFSKDDGVYYIKRIIGLPGESVQIIDGTVWINEEKLEEPAEREGIQEARRAETPVLLGKNEYFVLGDNRNDSSDSRDSTIGNVKKKDLIGKVVFCLPEFTP